MRGFMATVLALGWLAVPVVAEAKVTMYGASWCGPCRAVKGFLTSNGVPFAYVDIDTEEGRTAYERAPGSGHGIPLTVVDRTPVVGANLDVLVSLLRRARLMSDRAPSVEQTGERYGGHLPEWWQAQFRQLRDEIGRMDRSIEGLEDRALLHEVRLTIDRLKGNKKILEASLAQLQNDASRVALPRKFRQ